MSKPSGRLTCWRLRLSKSDFAIQYKKKLVRNFQADALSRLQTNAEAGTSSMNFDVRMFDALIDCNFIHFEFDVNEI